LRRYTFSRFLFRLLIFTRNKLRRNPNGENHSGVRDHSFVELR
jgi:hypothetical protein